MKNFNNKNEKGDIRVCITYTCLSDNSQIIENILWHQEIGAKLIILFLDRGVEEFKRKYGNIKNLILKKSASYVPTHADPTWVFEAFTRKNESYDFEKVLNVYHACNIAYSEYGCEWCISIDADEIIYLPKNQKNKNINSALMLTEYFGTVSDDILQVKFEAAELIPVRYSDNKDSFFGQNYFLTFPNQTFLFVSRSLNRALLALRFSGPKIELMISFLYFLCGYNLRNSFSCVVSGKSLKPYYLAYMGYKSAIRLPHHKSYIYSIHYWLNHWPKISPKSILQKYCLHFDLPTHAEYRKKSLYQIGNSLRYQNRRKIFEIGRSSNLNISMEYYESEISVPIESINKSKSVIYVFVEKPEA